MEEHIWRCAQLASHGRAYMEMCSAGIPWKSIYADVLSWGRGSILPEAQHRYKIAERLESQ
jgi:hypothetical protein